MRKIFVCFICPFVVSILSILNIFYIKDFNIKMIIHLITFLLIGCQFACVFMQGLEIKRMIEVEKKKYDNKKLP